MTQCVGAETLMKYCSEDKPRFSSNIGIGGAKHSSPSAEDSAETAVGFIIGSLFSMESLGAFALVVNKVMSLSLSRRQNRSY